MERTEIILVRHGQIDNPDEIVYGHLPLPLSKEGREQAKQIGEALKSLGIQFDKLIASPLARAKETAGIVAEVLKIGEMEFAEELVDNDVGTLQGAPLQLLKDVNYNDEELSKLGYDVETKESVLGRSLKFVKKTVKDNLGANIIMVSHGDVCRLVIWGLEYAEKQPPEILRDENYLACGEAVVLKFNGIDFVGKSFIRLENEEADNIKRTESS